MNSATKGTQMNSDLVVPVILTLLVVVSVGCFLVGFVSALFAPSLPMAVLGVVGCLGLFSFAVIVR
jgi:hypothetical protein